MWKRGFASLRLSLFWVNNVGVLKRGVSPSFQNLPLPLIKGKGIKGMGLPNKNLKGRVQQQSCYYSKVVLGELYAFL